MKRKPSPFRRPGQLLLALVLLTGLSVGISACARSGINTLADRTPQLDLVFGADSRASIFEGQVGNLRH